MNCGNEESDPGALADAMVRMVTDAALSLRISQGGGMRPSPNGLPLPAVSHRWKRVIALPWLWLGRGGVFLHR